MFFLREMNGATVLLDILWGVSFKCASYNSRVGMVNSFLRWFPTMVSINPDKSLKATPIVLAHVEGVASSDEDSFGTPWVKQTTSLPLSALHYPRLLK